MGSPSYEVVIAGAGIAGVTAAESIAERGGGETVLIVNGEDRAPYKRTKISKNIAGGFEPDAYSLHTNDWYASRGIEIWTGTSINAINTQDRSAGTSDGRSINWRSLVVSTGSLPRHLTLPTLKPGSYFVIRSAAQVEELIGSLGEIDRVAVIGLGVLGVEVTDQLCRLGKKVVSIGKESLVMPRDLNSKAAEQMHREIHRCGIDLRLEEEIEGIEREPSSEFRIELKSGVAMCELIILCIGSTPDINLARDSGIAVEKGIIVDNNLKTSVPGIFSAGDVAEHEGGYISRLWHAAEAQGRIAGLNAVGEELTYNQPPFRLKCEVFDRFFFSVGKPHPQEIANYEIVEVEAREYRCLYFRDDHLHGVVMIDDKERAKEYERAVCERWPR